VNETSPIRYAQDIPYAAVTTGNGGQRVIQYRWWSQFRSLVMVSSGFDREDIPIKGGTTGRNASPISLAELVSISTSFSIA